MTPLRGLDGEVYAFAQGSMVVSGFGVSGKDGSRISLNVPSSGRIPNGASVEREVPTKFAQDAFLVLNLNTPDFTTAARVAAGINKTLGAGTAEATDPVSIKVAAPSNPDQRIAYLATLEAIEIEPGEAPARVIINSRTGTVVISSHVQVTAAAVAHGSLVGHHHRAPGCEPAQLLHQGHDRHGHPAQRYQRAAGRRPHVRVSGRRQSG